MSNTVPAISWLAWGGQVGVLTFLLEQMFGDVVDQSIATKYRVTGSWEDPVITKISEPVVDIDDDSEEY